MNEAIITIDVHGMTRYQAKILIDSRLKNIKGVYRIRIIHGYHSGSEIKKMIRTEYGGKHPKVIRLEYGLNPGETDLVIREL